MTRGPTAAAGQDGRPSRRSGLHHDWAITDASPTTGNLDNDRVLDRGSHRTFGDDRSVDRSVLEWLRSLEDRCPTSRAVDVVALFVRETVIELAKLRLALARGDIVTATRGAHSVKGTSVSFGARHLPELCAALERTITAGDLPVALGMLAAVDAEFDRVSAALREDFPELPA